MTTQTDPVTALIEAIEAKRPAGETPAGTAGSALDAAGELIPARKATAVRDLLDSPELACFRRHYRKGLVEVELIDQAFGLLRAFLAAKGIL